MSIIINIKDACMVVNYLKVIGIRKDEGIRYIIIDKKTGEIIDDAQGYGYRSKQKAYRALSYKYRGGKEKLSKYETFWKKNKKIAKHIREIHTIWYKENLRAEITADDILHDILNKFNIDIPKDLLKHYELAFKGEKKVVDKVHTINTGNLYKKD